MNLSMLSSGFASRQQMYNDSATDMLQSLHYLSLEDNLLSGSLPKAWGNMTSLQYVNVEANDITGSVPHTWFQDHQASQACQVLLHLFSEHSTSQVLFKSKVSCSLTFFSKYHEAADPGFLQIQYVNLGGNKLSGTVPKLAEGAQLLDMSANALTSLSFQQLPTTLQVLRLGNNSIAGALLAAGPLPRNLSILDLSYNLLSGILPATLPDAMAVLNVSHNHLSGPLPTEWNPLAVVSLDHNNFWGNLPASWSTWGENTSNSVQLSLVDTNLHGHMPQKWVLQFCIAIVQNSSSQILFTPGSAPLEIETTTGSITKLVFFGSVIALPAQHASINVTLDGKNYTFDYQSPDSLCSIPGAQRNAAIFWGGFAAVLIGAVIGVNLWLRRQIRMPVSRKLAMLTSAASSALNHKRAQLPKKLSAMTWFFCTDVVWTLYSQVTDAITIHQVFSSGQLLYAYLLLGILLLPFLCIFMLVARLSVKHCQSRFLPIGGHQPGCMSIAGRHVAAILVGILYAPVLFSGLEAAMLTEGFGVDAAIAAGLLPSAWELTTFYRAHSVAEAFLSALPQAVVQTKLYIMGNDPKGIHVYINTTLFMYSVVGSGLSILKTVVLMIIELHQFHVGLVLYFSKMVEFACLNVQSYQAGVPAGTALGQTSSGTVLLPSASGGLPTSQVA